MWVTYVHSKFVFVGDKPARPLNLSDIVFGSK